MEIIELKKGKKNTYIVTTSSQEKLIFYDDIIVKYSLIPKKKLSEKTFQEIQLENQKLEAYYAAIQYLSIKMRTKKELKKYLEKKGFSSLEIEESIKRLTEEGYLKEKEYIQSFCHDAFCFTNDGPLKIQKKLTDLGLSNVTLEQILQIYSKEVWLEKLERLFQKKENSKHNDGVEKWKLKCEQYFVNLGYPKDWIWEIEANITWSEDSQIIQKEYEKIQRKLSRKYAGKELNFQIYRKLYEKGFRKEEIEKVLSNQ